METRKQKVLILEDDLETLATIVIQLREKFEVYCCTDGIEGLEALERNFVPDVISTDLVMPRMDGREFVREINKRVDMDNVPIIVFSGMHEDVDKTQFHRKKLIVEQGGVSDLVARVRWLMHAPN